jgi:hypothetical protein
MPLDENLPVKENTIMSAKLYQINNQSEWGKATRLQRRFQGFLCYIICAIFSLKEPEAVDMALYSTLKNQFIDNNPLINELETAILHIELANSEGNMILSAWLPDAKKAVAKARGAATP